VRLHQIRAYERTHLISISIRDVNTLFLLGNTALFF